MSELLEALGFTRVEDAFIYLADEYTKLEGF